jgi:catechol 2,3-dioxygenase
MANLICLHLRTPQLELMQQFYVEQFGMQPAFSSANQVILAGPQRLLMLEAAEKPAMANAFFCVPNAAKWREGQAVLNAHKAKQIQSPLYEGAGLQVLDPEGNAISFGVASQFAQHALRRKVNARALEGRLQHYGVGTKQPVAMQQFYLHGLRFALSDEVFGDDGQLRGSFLRTTEEHHSIAIFGNGKPGFDHMSFEVSDWNTIKTWADHFATFENKIFWGPGRHGAGNNVFIFVYDPDRNMVEISAELEIKTPDAPAGRWGFDYKAYNTWGQAAVRV